MRRIATFVAVGGLGFALQFIALAGLAGWAGWTPLPATAVAVELAVLHNFWWHERFTWRDRTAGVPGPVRRLARYHAATGLTTIGNVGTTLTLVQAGMGLLAANVVAVGIMSALNFLLSDRWAFDPGEARSSLADGSHRDAGRQQTPAKVGGQYGSTRRVAVHAERVDA
jgi:putative flippase GtrA